MTAHISKPAVEVHDANGNPYVGAVMYIYEVGTTTLASIYSDRTLTTPLTNPLSGANASDARGQFPRVYVSAGQYKIRIETSAGVQIDEWDYTDTGLTAGSGALAITGGGTGATTAAGARTALGAAAQTDVDDLADDIADLNTALQGIVAAPQGYLTLTSGTPVLITGVSAGTSVYYTQDIGKLIPVYDGSLINMEEFASELSLTLNSNHVASAIYDAFVFKNSGNLILGTGPAWNTATAGAGARGTGAGTTELTKTIGGFRTNANAMTARNGATTYSVAANQGTYVGSLFMDGSAGQITCHRDYGQSRKWGVWNAYNKKRILLKAGDPNASWNYNSATVRAANGSGNNSITIFAGLAEEQFDLITLQQINAGVNTANVAHSGVGFNSTTAISGTSNGGAGVTSSGALSTFTFTTHGRYIAPPSLGINQVYILETSGEAVSKTFYGTEANMLLSAEYMG